MTQKERQERSREEIYRAAREEFGAHGYDQVNMERICGNHGISKGMMYHYYSNKDELFLLCVERTLEELRGYIEEHMVQLPQEDVLTAIKDYFLIREQFFQLRPEQKLIFEDAVLHPPKHLADQIHRLRAPMRELNWRFIADQVARMPLRPGLDQEKVARYLESIEFVFQSAMVSYHGREEDWDLHGMLEAAEELIDMVLFGVLQRAALPAAFPEKDGTESRGTSL